MSVEMGLWRIGERPERIIPTGAPQESQLETWIQQDPSLLETTLLIIGSQVRTDEGKRIDLLGLDEDGVLHVLELKRNKTPRDVVAQVLEYGAWVQELNYDRVLGIFAENNPEREFEVEFARVFGDAAPVPEDLNAGHVLTIVAAEMDSSTEKIVTYLNSVHAVPINVVFFKYFQDAGNAYLARTWLVRETDAGAAVKPTSKSSPSRAPWNGRDWYVSFGDESATDGRDWEDARRYGFVSAGGGRWYSQKLANLPVGARIFTYVPKTGYVGVGVVEGHAMRAEAATLEVDGKDVPFSSLDLRGGYTHASPDFDDAEFVVPVKWLHTVPLTDAFKKPGLFANQNPATKLRNQFTIDEVTEAFDLAED